MSYSILSTMWLPEDIISRYKDFRIDIPQPEITGKLPMDEVLKRLPDYDAVLIAGEKFDKAVIDQGLSGKMRVIGRHGVGCDAVDYAYAGSKGVAVINTPVAVTEPTAELTIAIMMAAARSVVKLDAATRREGCCIFPPSFGSMSSGLYGKTLGIIGFGRIGKAVAVKAHGLGMKIVYTDMITADPAFESRVGARKVSQEELLAMADVVSLHCPYLSENHHLINDETLSRMKPGAYLVNASRGKMVDEAALVAALKKGTIKGAALDVFEFEPEINNELLRMDNVVITPHVGTCCYEARHAMAVEALDGISSYLRGETPPNLFNAEFMVKLLH